MVYLGRNHIFNLEQFSRLLHKKEKLEIHSSVIERLKETRLFVDYLLANSIPVYGLTTGFADLRNTAIPPEKAAELSCNIIASHDAGIGSSLPPNVILGAMVIRAVSLSKGYSAIQESTLRTLVQMINHRIIPWIPKTGSLGACGDLAFLARMGRAMQGEEVPVWHEDKISTAKEVFKTLNISPMTPLAKEGLAITNGTSFMSSMLSIAYLQEIHELENSLALQGVFLDAIGAIDAAYYLSIQQVRSQMGQHLIAEILSRHLNHSPFIDREGIQDDYCIRCIPQIMGPKVESILEQAQKIEREINAATDNPLFFLNEEISADVNLARVFHFSDQKWAVLSGGNFHGECITTIVDNICMANAKIALLMERQISYMLNPARNKKKLPCYLINDPQQLGLFSGYMITQYTANALAQKIAQLGNPTSIFNITSANESEDIVSYGSAAAERLLEQLSLIRELNVVYMTVVMQAYSITRSRYIQNGYKIPLSCISENIFQKVQGITQEEYPINYEANFEKRYSDAGNILSSSLLPSMIGFPLCEMQKHLSSFENSRFPMEKYQFGTLYGFQEKANK